METHGMGEAVRQHASNDEIIAGLNDLLRLDHDALGAYEIAIEKLEDRDHAAQIEGFRRDHERHVRELDRVIGELGGTPRHEPHVTGPFKQALQSVGALAGDKGVLVAWRTNELLVRSKYDAYAARANRWPAEVKRVVDENALDEERHYDWVVDVLQAMGVGPGSDLETAAATRLREAGTRLEGLAGRARDAASHAGAAARNRIAGMLDSAADRIEGGESRGEAGAPRGQELGQRVASGMHSSARYVRGADLERVRTDLEGSTRRHPLRTLTLFFATGFVLGRLLR